MSGNLVAKKVFGSVAMVRPDAPVLFSLALHSEGSIGENYGVQQFFIDVTFCAEGLSFAKRIHVATGTDGYGHTEPWNIELFRALFKGGLTDQVSSNVAMLLVLEYRKDEGEVSTDLLILALYSSLLGRKKVA